MHSRLRNTALDYGLDIFVVFSNCPFLLSVHILRITTFLRHHIISAFEKVLLGWIINWRSRRVAIGTHKCKHFPRYRISEISLVFSKDLVPDSNRKPDEFSGSPPILLIRQESYYNVSIYFYVPQSVFYSHLIFLKLESIIISCEWFKIMTFLIMQFSITSFLFPHLLSRNTCSFYSIFC
jgi:hypothetical protein